MSWKPFIPDVNEWKKHFVESVDMKYIPNQKTYVIGQFGNGSRPVTQIELITPTQQAVEMARSELKKRKIDGEPIVHFRRLRRRKSRDEPLRRREIHLFTPNNFFFQ